MNQEQQHLLFMLRNFKHNFTEDEYIILLLTIYEIPIGKIAKLTRIPAMKLKKIQGDLLRRL